MWRGGVCVCARAHALHEGAPCCDPVACSGPPCSALILGSRLTLLLLFCVWVWVWGGGGQVGFYCPEGSSTATQVPGPASFFCPPSSFEPTACPPGQWSGQGSAVCSPCDAGRYGATAGVTSLCTDACAAGYAGHDS